MVGLLPRALEHENLRTCRRMSHIILTLRYMPVWPTYALTTPCAHATKGFLCRVMQPIFVIVLLFKLQYLHRHRGTQIPRLHLLPLHFFVNIMGNTVHVWKISSYKLLVQTHAHTDRLIPSFLFLLALPIHTTCSRYKPGDGRNAPHITNPYIYRLSRLRGGI